MTQEYKDDILDYITNNVTVTQGTNEPQFTDSEVLDKSVSDRIKELLGENFIFCGDLNDENTKNIIIYGYGRDSNNGFIYMCDSNLEELQMITTFSSGTTLFPLNDMHVDENGYLYAISVDQNKTKRVLLFNNIFSKVPGGEYQAKLRQSYIVPNGEAYDFLLDSIFTTQKTKKIIKVPEESTYYIFLYQPGSPYLAYILRFTINVGSDNEWVFTGINSQVSTHDCLIEKNGEKHTLYFYYTNENENEYFESTIEEDTYTQIKKLTLDINLDFIFAKSKNDIYVVGTDSNNRKLEKIENSSIKLIDTFQDSLSSNFTMKLQNNIIFLFVEDKIGILQNDVPFYSSSITPRTTIVTFFVITSYNLANIFVATGTSVNPTTTRFTLDYNVNNYNGLEYSDYNQTLATKARLYSGGQMVFARNLYNTTLLGNIATSNLQVPNTLINGIPIVIESLVGATNGILINDTTPVTKNIYETLYINFIRSISVKDEDTDTEYPSTASYINQNINTATQQNCENTFIGKVNVNYENSTITQNINWTYVTDHYETTFVIDATNEVPTIDFISNDETTIYLTKELDVSTGHYYTIKQKLRIE